MDFLTEAEREQTYARIFHDADAGYLVACDLCPWRSYTQFRINAKQQALEHRCWECPACHERGINGHYDGREKCQAIAGSGS